jgi:hypothetical protein
VKRLEQFLSHAANSVKAGRSSVATTRKVVNGDSDLTCLRSSDAGEKQDQYERSVHLLNYTVADSTRRTP